MQDASNFKNISKPVKTLPTKAPLGPVPSGS
jgi:hypothetical protein